MAAQVRPDAPLLVGVDDERGALEPRLHAEPLEREEGRAQVVGPHSVNRDGAVRDGGEADKRTDLDVVGSDCVGGGVEPALPHPVDGERVGPDAVDAGAAGHEEPRQVLHVGLGSGVA